MPLDRRTFLISGLGGIVTVTGCLGRDNGDGPGNDGDDDTRENDEDNDTRESDEDNDTRENDVLPEEPRTDDPPYEIEKPEYPDDPDDEDEWNELYLCENMPSDPSLPFEVLPRAGLESPALSGPKNSTTEYVVHLLRSENERDDLLDLDASSDAARETLQAIDFDEQVLVVVESGYGSSSVRHHWNRVEDVEDGVHLHGCYTQPLVRTTDVAPRHSVIAIDRPSPGAEIDLARVSLTVNENRRVHVNSTEDVVTVEE